MRTASLIAGTALAIGMMAAAAPSQAAPRLPHMSATSDIVTQIRDDDDDDHHGMRRHGDDDRGWNWRRRHDDDDGGWNWRRRHHRYDVCRDTRHECADRFGWGSWRYRRCVHRHGC